jgi:hypothetical protein
MVKEEPLGYIRIALALALAAGLAACRAPEPRTLAPADFIDLAPIVLDVAAVEVVDAWNPPGRPPNVDHQFPDPPASALSRWAAQRFVAGGSAGRAVVTIEEAGVVEERLETTGGIRGVFTVDQAERYSAVLRVSIRADNPATLTTAEASAVAQRSTTLAEDASFGERQAAWASLTEGAVRDLDARLMEEMLPAFGRLVRR